MNRCSSGTKLEFTDRDYIGTVISPLLRLFARRALALLAIVGVMGSAAAPACEGMAKEPSTVQQSGVGDAHCAPAPATHRGSPRHHEVPRHQAPCAMGICIAGAMPARVSQGHVAPTLLTASPAETVPVSAPPQHTTPPPRA